MRWEQIKAFVWNLELSLWLFQQTETVTHLGGGRREPDLTRAPTFYLQQGWGSCFETLNIPLNEFNYSNSTKVFMFCSKHYCLNTYPSSSILYILYFCKILIPVTTENQLILKTWDYPQFNTKGISMLYKVFMLSLRAFLPKLEGIPL